ncbi:MAG: BatA domain-containing protein [Chloroflexi bacterium]|nr:BatA domain-containing protein [Chloroflexota bacterium]
MSLSFATPWVLALLPVVLALALYPRFARERTKPAGMRYSDTSLTRVEVRSVRLRLRPILPILRWVAVALVVVSAARPQLSEAREIISGEGVDIILALDISGSMAALDFEPLNRLEAATAVISDFIDEGYERALQLMRRRHDLVAIALFDPRERELPDVGFINLQDAETGEWTLVDTADEGTRKNFRTNVLRTKSERERLFRKSNVDEILIRTDRSYIEPIMKFFRVRERKR